MEALDFNAPTPEEKAEATRRKAEITRRVRREVLEKHGRDRLPSQGARDLVTGGQGTGKSRTVAETIAKLPASVAWWWLVPTLEKAEEQADEYSRLATPSSAPAMVVRGRRAPDPNAPGEAMCPRHEVANRAAAMGVKVEKHICGDCPRRHSCGFQRQKKEIEPQPVGLFLMSHEYLWMPSHAPRPDVVIVDEAVTHRAADTISFEPSRITEDDKWSDPKDIESAMERRRIATVVRRAIVENPGNELEFLHNEGISRDDLKSGASHLLSREEAIPNVCGSMSDREIHAALDAVQQREILKIYRLFRQLVREYDMPRRGTNTVWFIPDWTVTVEGVPERQARVFVGHVRRPRVGKSTPVLCLDGTGSLTLNRHVFGETMEGHAFKAPRDAKVIQTEGKMFSRQSLTGRDRHSEPVHSKSIVESARLRGHIVNLLSLLPGKVLLVTYKALKEVIMDDLPEHVHVAHFGAVRGLNAFEQYETVVVLGREQPSAGSIEEQTRPFTAADPEPFRPQGEYVLQSRGRRMRAGGPNVTPVWVHSDPRCQQILEQHREAEAVQAVDRVRPIFNHRTVILLTDLVLDITVDQVVPWRELRPSAFVIAFARFGVLPLTPSDMAKAFPDLWSSPKAAEHALRRRKETTPVPQTYMLFGVWGEFFPTLVRATYRRHGQRGPLAHAVLYAGLPDLKIALEALVGKLAQFALDMIEMPSASARPNEPPRDAPPGPPKLVRSLPPLATALAAEAHLLATSDPIERPPDILGFAGVRRIMACAAWTPHEAAAA